MPMIDSTFGQGGGLAVRSDVTGGDEWIGSIAALENRFEHFEGRPLGRWEVWTTVLQRDEIVVGFLASYLVRREGLE